MSVPVFDFGNPTWIAVVATTDTPAEMQGYAGRYLPVSDPSTMPAIGTRGIVQVSGVQVPGYLRQTNGNYEWVITAPVDPLEDFVSGLPGANGWSDQPSHDVWQSIADSLRGRGITDADLGYALPALYNAARTNLLKEYGVS